MNSSIVRPRMRVFAASLLLIVSFPLSCLADLYSGFLTGNGGGIVATDGWVSNDTKITWDVTFDGTKWHYEYEFTVPTKDISHIIIEVSPSFTGADYLSGPDHELGTFGTQGNSNPGIPESVYGLKFGANSTSWSVAFDSTRAPVWGDFYAKDGRDGHGQDQIDVYAYNLGFTAADMDDGGHIAVPDTVSVVPVPGAFLLGMLGLGAAGVRLRRKV